MLLVLSLAGFGAGCASQKTWHPVEAEAGMVYDSPRQLASERWPDAGYQYYRVRYYAPEIELDINQHQRIANQTVVIPFVSSLASSDGPP